MYSSGINVRCPDVVYKQQNLKYDSKYQEDSRIRSRMISKLRLQKHMTNSKIH